MNQKKTGPKDRGRSNNRRRRRPNRSRPKKDGEKSASSTPQPEAKQIPKRYGVIFYDTFMQAKEDHENLLGKAKEVDQLNIVIKAEGPMDDPELLQYGQLYAGEAWTLIHQRRVEEKWYEEPH